MSAAVLTQLRQAARTEQAWLAVLTPPQLPLLRSLLRQAHTSQQHDPGFRAEWAAWTGQEQGATVGVPAASSGPLPEPQDAWILRDFSGGTARRRIVGKDFEPNPLIVMIGSFHDLPLARLQRQRHSRERTPQLSSRSTVHAIVGFWFNSGLDTRIVHTGRLDDHIHGPFFCAIGHVEPQLLVSEPSVTWFGWS